MTSYSRLVVERNICCDSSACYRWSRRWRRVGWRHNDVRDSVLSAPDLPDRCGKPRSGYRFSIDSLGGGMPTPVHPHRRIGRRHDVESDHLCGTTIVYCKDVQVGNRGVLDGDDTRIGADPIPADIPSHDHEVAWWQGWRRRRRRR